MSTAIITFSAVLLVGLSYIAYCERKEYRRIKRVNDSYPKCGKVRKELDRLLDYDCTENFYHN
jgi:hypothetical protein